MDFSIIGLTQQLKTASQLSLNSALQIASITSDSTLPSWIKMTGAGSWYTMTFPTDSGLNIKANIAC